MAGNQSVTLFISYAHRDEELKSQLDKHLTPLKLQKVIEKWSDRQIQGGQDWAHQIDSNLRNADIILLLVSPDFVSSDYCTGVELKTAMARYRDGDAIVVPVILEPCDWTELDFGKLQATPKDGKAVTDWSNINSAFLDVTNRIRQVAQGLLDKRQKKQQERQAASERYKAKVEQVLSDGDITPLEHKTLNELRDKLGLTAEEAEAIKDSAYQPLREYQSKLAQYRLDLVETIQREYPLSERTKVDLRQRHRELGLKAEDAERLEAEVLAGAEAQARRQAEQGDRRQRDDTRQQAADGQARESRQDRPQQDPVSLQLQQAPAAPAVAAPTSPQPPTPPSASVPVATGRAALPPISIRTRIQSAGTGAAIYVLAVVIGSLLAGRSVQETDVIAVTVLGAIGGAIIAGYRWIAIVAVASLLAQLASGEQGVAGAFLMFGLIGGAVVVPLRRWLHQKKSRSGTL